MWVIKVSTIKAYWQRPGCGDAEQALKAWVRTISMAQWAAPADVKAQFRNASFVGSNRVVFNIGGNKYRLIVAIAHRMQIAYVKFIGTHAEYDRVDATTVDLP